MTAGLDHLSATVRRLSPDLVVIAVQRGRPEVFGQLLLVAETGFRISGLPEMYESTFGRLPIEELTPAWFMSVLHAYNRPTSRLGKRAFDIVVALLGMLVSLPLVLPRSCSWSSGRRARFSTASSDSASTAASSRC